MASNIPTELSFTEHDEWVRQEDDLAVVGITDHAQDALGEIVHVELPDLDSEVGVGDEVGEIESVKAVAEIYSPVSGVIVEINDALDDEPELLNSDPYANWIYKVKMTDPDELSGLLDAAAYEQKLAED